jgi:predicted pyridoxine 5'-phosphate oxidase superfamily flavin-nucleotide-binding protein
MKRVVDQQRLGFFATVCEDRSPNASPKGTTYVLDDDRLLFADIRSPTTVTKIRRGSAVEVSVVGPFARKGYRFEGEATVHERGSRLYEDGLEVMRRAGSTVVDRVKAIVVIDVREARPPCRRPMTTAR